MPVIGSSSALGWRSVGVALGRLGQAIGDQRHDEQQEEQVHRRTRPPPRSSWRSWPAVRLGHQDLRPAEWLAPGHEVGQEEQVERDHEAVDRVRQHRRPQERDRDVPELLPAAGAVHLGGLVELARDALERAGGDDRVERPAQPRVGDEHREVGERQREERDRVVRLAQPVEVEARCPPGSRRRRRCPGAGS